MQKAYFSLHHLDIDGAGEVVCNGFDPVAYSRFKYGFTPPGIAYGIELADRIWLHLGPVLDAGIPILIVSAPYRYLPTASHLIATSLCHELSRRAVERGSEPPVLVPFHKMQVGDSTYAQSTKEDRLKTLATLGLHIDESLVPGSHLLVVDDIRITGAAEEATAAYLEPLEPISAWYLHAASFDRQTAIDNPEIEDKLNQTVPHTLTGIIEEDVMGRFALNTRVLRHILETPDHSDLEIFLRQARKKLVREIYEAAIGTGPGYCSRHGKAVALMAQALGH